METRFRTRETEILLAEQTKQRWLYFGLIVLLGLLSGGAVYAYLKKKKDNKEMSAQRNLIEKQANECGINAFVTTVKDAVKLSNFKFQIPCFVVEIEMLVDDEEAFKSLI